MRGIGGPLLCIGDLLGDVGESDTSDSRHDQTLKSPPSHSSSHPDLHFQPSDLSKVFQENYDRLNKALSGTDHSWTSLTLKVMRPAAVIELGSWNFNMSFDLCLERLGQRFRAISEADDFSEFQSLCCVGPSVSFRFDVIHLASLMTFVDIWKY
ncbi:hypothetical protein Cgig2_029494 [Carnegiea gigantea]|uniref:Uncharacterized protein n=1 Tax=Carnegiea gigantea TaxID=171969 RepID=A0A9Q1QK14_9CARY|nr:hypothetical protein Cgig2_029494 [Carnegiea gigantea]